MTLAAQAGFDDYVDFLRMINSKKLVICPAQVICSHLVSFEHTVAKVVPFKFRNEIEESGVKVIDKCFVPQYITGICTWMSPFGGNRWQLGVTTPRQLNLTEKTGWQELYDRAQNFGLSTFHPDIIRGLVKQKEFMEYRETLHLAVMSMKFELEGNVSVRRTLRFYYSCGSHYLAPHGEQEDATFEPDDKILFSIKQ